MSNQKPIYRMSPDDRLGVIVPLVGRRVDLVVDSLRDGRPETLTGLLVSMARPQFGTTADLVILRRSGEVDLAFSVATVVSVTQNHDVARRRQEIADEFAANVRGTRRR